MKININMSAVFAHDNLTRTGDMLSDSIEKLSSGYKINHAKDNPSGIAIARRMHAQIRGLDQASQNASDGISVIEIAEGALTEVHDMLQRLNELSIQASNGTMEDSDRESVQEEVNALLDEISRISKSTEFNGSTLLDGTYDLKAYVEDSPNATPGFDLSAIGIESYSDEAKVGYYEVEIETDTDPETGELYVKSATITDSPNATVNGKDVELKHVANQKISLDQDKHTITITGDDAFSLTLDIDLDKMGATTQTVNINLTGIGAMTMQIGSNEGQTLDIRIPTISPKTLGIAELDISTKETATASIDRVANGINVLSTIRARLGAYQNRLEHSISSLDITEENMTSAYSRIMDLDMAEEMTEYTKDQVLSQAGTSMLAQANERPSQILQLLQ